MNDDIALMWLNWSVVTINSTLQLLDNGEWYRKNGRRWNCR